MTKQEIIKKERGRLKYIYDSKYQEYLANPKQFEDDFGTDYCNRIKHIGETYDTVTDEELYNTIFNGYGGNDRTITFDGEEFSGWDEDGNCISTYNPKSKWDWYSVGGRWGGMFNGKDRIPLSSLPKDCMYPFAFIDLDGNWHEMGEMGWFGMSANNMEEDVWQVSVTSYIDSLKDKEDVYITAVDCHI